MGMGCKLVRKSIPFPKHFYVSLYSGVPSDPLDFTEETGIKGIGLMASYKADVQVVSISRSVDSVTYRDLT